MADFTLEAPGTGGGSHSSSSHSKKGMKISKPMLYIGGAVLIILFLVIKGKSSQQDTAAPMDETTVGYPSNSVDVASQLQNNADIVNGQVEAQLNGFMADFNSQEIQREKDYQDQLKAITDKLSAMQPVTDTTTAHPTPATIPPKPVPTAPAPVSKPAPLKTESAGIVYHVPKAGWMGSSIVDYLKSKGQKNDFNSRAKLASQAGIKGYTGTAAQNTAILNRLRGK